MLRATRFAVLATTASLLSPVAVQTVAAQATAAESTATTTAIPAPSLDRRLGDARIRESSGLAWSTYAKDRLYTHNDSGDSPRLFAVTKSGTTESVLTVKGASARDWEDIAAGPNHTLWIGDIGDNGRARASVQIYRVMEPSSPAPAQDVAATRYNFTYEGGPQNAEALLVHPRTGQIYIATKRESGGAIFKAPTQLSTSQTNVLRRVASAPAKITAGAFAPDGNSFALTNYTDAFVYSQVGSTPRVVDTPPMRQGESLEISRDGSALVVGSEGLSSPVYSVPLGASLLTEPVAEPVTEPAAAPAAATARVCAKAPAYTGTGTAFGVSLTTRTRTIHEAVAEEEGRFGRLAAVRLFDSSVPPSNAWTRRSAVLSGKTIVTSFRMPPREVVTGKYDAQLRGFFQTAPTDRNIFWSYFHEPEPHIRDGVFTFDQYRAAWRHIVNLAATQCRANLFPTLILTGYTTKAMSKRNWRDYYPGDEYISLVAFDPYNSASKRPTIYGDPATLFDTVVQVSRESGKPWGIAETGSVLIDGDSGGSGRAAWLNQVGQYFKSKGAAFVTYYQSTGSSGAVYTLTDSRSVAAWRNWVQ